MTALEILRTMTPDSAGIDEAIDAIEGIENAGDVKPEYARRFVLGEFLRRGYGLEEARLLQLDWARRKGDD